MHTKYASTTWNENELLTLLTIGLFYCNFDYFHGVSSEFKATYLATNGVHWDFFIQSTDHFSSTAFDINQTVNCSRNFRIAFADCNEIILKSIKMFKKKSKFKERHMNTRFVQIILKTKKKMWIFLAGMSSCTWIHMKTPMNW